MRELNFTKGIWLSRDLIGFDGGDWNPYRYVENNPVIYIDPTGHTPVMPGVPLHNGSILRCPPSDPTDGDYAIACSKSCSSYISESFTLPSLCNVPDEFINFYLSMGPGGATDFEAGVSFSPRHKGWNAFFNAQGHQFDDITSVSAGQTVHMSLKRTKSGQGIFTINGQSRTSPGRLPNISQVRVVSAAKSAKC